jgi:hypothetical protein
VVLWKFYGTPSPFLQQNTRISRAPQGCSARGYPLEQALSEARFLRSQFAVEVRELEAGEEAGMPRPAGDFELPQKN